MSIYFFDVFLRDARCAVIFVFVGGGGEVLDTRGNSLVRKTGGFGGFVTP